MILPLSKARPQLASMNGLLRAVALLVVIAPLSFGGAFRVMARDGSPVGDVQICRFVSGGTDSPHARYFFSSEVKCSDATGFELPSGEWNVFAQGTNSLSTEVLLLSVASVDTTLVMGEAKRVRAEAIFGKRESGRWAAMYRPSNSSSIPVSGETVLIPSEETVVPLLVIQPDRSRAGEPRLGAMPFRSVDELSARVPPHTIGWVRSEVDPPPAFEIVVRDGAKESQPLAPVRLRSAADMPLVIFANTGAKQSVIELRGDGVATDARSIPKTTAGSYEELPFVLRHGSKVVITWSTAHDVAAIAEKPRTCDPEEAPRSEIGTWSLELLDCPGIHPDRDERFVDIKQCAVLRTTGFPLSARRGSATWEKLAPGLRMVRLTYPNLAPKYGKVFVSADRDETAHVELRYFRIFGRVTKGGEPVEAVVRFSAGDAKSDSVAGEYEAFLPLDPSMNNIQVSQCETERSLGGADEKKRRASPREAYIHIPDEPPQENQRFDIEIPTNRIRVQVVDATTRLPVGGAAVGFAALLPKGPSDGAHFAGERGETDDEGKLDISEVATNRGLSICVRHDRYVAKCTDTPIRVGAREKYDLHVAIDPAELRQGVVRGAGPFVWGEISWFSPSGRRLEVAPLKEDGSFTYKNSHRMGEIITVIARNQPLFVTRMASDSSDRKLEIGFPLVPSVSFRVKVDGGGKGWNLMTVRIGDLVVPLHVFGQHMRKRRLHLELTAEQPLFVPDIAATGPIRVVVAPDAYLKSRWQDDIDPFYLPDAGSLPQHVIDPNGVVTIRLD